MTFPTVETRNTSLARALLLLAAAGLLSGCETTGSGTSFALVSKPPMTRSRAAMECWMRVDKGNAGANLDKRADIVSRCIANRMKAA